MHVLAPILVALACPQTSLGPRELRDELAAAPRGKWGTPLNHRIDVAPGFVNDPAAQSNGQRFNSIHLALIPQPSANAGLVLGMDKQDQSDASGWSQRWTILDPSTDPPTILWNDEIIITGQGSGNLFCSGHAWMADGRLFVAGGTSFFGHVFGGAKLALIYDPAPGPGAPYGTWTFLPPMAIDRWYPTVTLLGDDRILVSGGSHLAANQNSYEVYDPVSGTWEVDPSTQRTWFPGTPVATLVEYPRMHLLSDGSLFMCGPQRTAARLDHGSAPGVWSMTDNSTLLRHDGSAVLLPKDHGQEDEVMILGGAEAHTFVWNSTERAHPMQGSASWSDGPSLLRKRVHMNVVLLPDKSMLAVGGNDIDAQGNRIEWRDAEWRKDGAWAPLVAGASTRDYHSTAVLLPDGRVLSAGGDHRHWDWQLLWPPYFDVSRPRPRNVSLPGGMDWGYAADGAGPYQIDFDALPAGVTIERAVLLTPGSITHHSDMGARFVDLPILAQGATSVQVEPPFNSCQAPNPTFSCAPRGYYMLFLVSSAGVPSHAVFVRLQ